MESTSTPPPTPRASVLESLLTFLVISLLTILALRSLVPPSPVPANAAMNAFSAERAVEHLKVIAREPHPTGSAENARVRTYIVDQLKSLGLEQQVQKAVSSTTWDYGGAPYGSGTVQNVMARLQGTNSRGALLLMAHYDSVATGPGAADNGSGVVTLLETLRALRSGAPLANDVMVVFTDGEEDGGLGAQAFVDEHPWAREVSLAVIADSGSCGRVGLGVSSHHNGWLVREFTKAVPHPLAASVSDETSKLSGGSANGDHLPLYSKGIPVLALGAAGCPTTYHTAQDNPGTLDRRTVQDLGEYELRLARHFGNLDLKHMQESDVIYFPFLERMVVYPVAGVLPLVVLTLLVFLSTVFLGFKRNRLTPLGLALGFLVWAAAAFVAGVSIAFLYRALLSFHLVNKSFASAYNAETYALAFVSLAAAITSGLYVAFQRKISYANLNTGAFLWSAALMTVTYVFAPRITYLVMWPLLFALISLLLDFAFEGSGSKTLKLVKLLCAVPAIVLLALLIGYMVISPGDDLSQALLIVGLLTALTLTLLAPQLEVMTAHIKWLLPAACVLAAIGLTAFGAIGSGYDAAHPKPDSMSYWFDYDAGKASWISFDERPDSWTSQFLTGQVETDKVGIFGSADGDAVLKASAPRVELAAPVVKTVEDSTAGGERILRFHITSLRQARILWVIVRKVSVIHATLDGRHVQVGEGDARNKLWGIIYVGLPPKGIDLQLTVKALDNPELTVTDQSDGLPDVPGFRINPRASDKMPSPQEWPSFDSTLLVSRTFPARRTHE